MKDRTNQVAVITGGAGGIGIASAEMWMKQNGKIVACDIDVEKGKAFEAKYPGKVVFQLCDTRKFDDLEKAVETAKKMGQFTCFFNNAGGGSPSDTLEDSYDNIEGLKNMVEILLKSAVCLGGKCPGGVLLTEVASSPLQVIRRLRIGAALRGFETAL